MHLVIRDYFLEFSKLIENQTACAAVLSAFFEGSDRPSAEQEYKNIAKTSMEEILFQKKAGLIPCEKERACLALSELLFHSQLTLLHIPELFRIYHAEHLKGPFGIFLPEVRACCFYTCRFAMPAHAKDRFLKSEAEPIFDCCLTGFKKCKQFDEMSKEEQLSRVELLLLKDIDEEFASFFLLNLKFAHCALHFPI